MGTFEKFTKFRESLKGDERAALDAMLADVMSRHAEPDSLTDEQREDIERRLADPDPTYADARSVNAVFGRPLPH